MFYPDEKKARLKFGAVHYQEAEKLICPFLDKACNAIKCPVWKTIITSSELGGFNESMGYCGVKH